MISCVNTSNTQVFLGLLEEMYMSPLQVAQDYLGKLEGYTQVFNELLEEMYILHPAGIWCQNDVALTSFSHQMPAGQVAQEYMGELEGYTGIPWATRRNVHIFE